MFLKLHPKRKGFLGERPYRQKRRRLVKVLTVIAFALVCLPKAPAVAEAESPQEKGLRLALEADARNKGFGGFTAEMTMLLFDRQGRESRRNMRFKVLEVPDDGDKSLFVFDQPRDVQGTAFLTHAHINSQDDQWLYLPALKRVKRISAAKRAGSFMGSEFSYEDMNPPIIEEFTYRFVRDEPCGDLMCNVVEHLPLEQKSGYGRKLIWQDFSELRAWKVELFDRKGAHIKTLTFKDYRQYLDKFWRAGDMTMVNHQNGKSTVLKWSNFHFRTDLDDKEFTQTALRRAR